MNYIFINNLQSAGALKKAANNAGKLLLAPQWPHGWTYADEALPEQESHQYQASMELLQALRRAWVSALAVFTN
jgi:hypothetical protein